MRETKFWTWHMAAGVVILVLLGLHMMIMHTRGLTGLFVVDKGVEADLHGELPGPRRQPLLHHHLRPAPGHGPLPRPLGLRTILFELTLKPATREGHQRRSSWCWASGSSASAPGRPSRPTATPSRPRHRRPPFRRGGNHGRLTTRPHDDVVFHVRRYTPERDKAPYIQSFTVPVQPGHDRPGGPPLHQGEPRPEPGHGATPAAWASAAPAACC